MTTACFVIPLPPSTNGLFFNRPRKGRCKTTAYKAWIEAAGWEIRRQRVPAILGEVIIDLVIERPGATSDLDNRIKAALDAMQKAHVIENDNRVIDLHARWGDVKGCDIMVRSAETVKA